MTALGSPADDFYSNDGPTDRRRSDSDRRSGTHDRRRDVAEMHKAMEDRYIAFQEAERQRIAGDLHDSIGSSLSLTKFKLEGALERTRANQSYEALPDLLAEIASEVSTVIDELRRTAMNLRPSILDDLGLIATISWFARDIMSSRSDIEVQQQASVVEDDIPDSLKSPMFRILQEATRNALKHSAASVIRITLSKDSDVLRLVVEDNGSGFDVQRALDHATPRNTYGIASMRQRMRHSGGTLDIRSSAGSGTQVIASWRRNASR